MLSNSIRQFLNDERGGYTIWSLVWFILYVCIGGLAVDMTDAYRNQSLLQSTADAAALAGVMSLPDEAEATYAATGYSAANMTPEVHGTVLKDAEVFIGTWDFDNALFTAGTTDPNAVYVITRRAAENQNAVAANFLRILALFGFNPWFNVNAEAVAVKYIPDCLVTNGLTAFNKVDMTSNNELEDICIHGENKIKDPAHDYAIEIQNNGTIGQGVQFSTPDTEDFIDRNTVCSNDDLCTDDGEVKTSVLVEGEMMPVDAFAITDAIEAMWEQSTSNYMPDYMYTTNEELQQVLAPYETIDLSNCPECTSEGNGEYTYNGILSPGTLYVVDCVNSDDLFKLPDSTVQPEYVNVGVISECRLSGAQGSNFTDSMLASWAPGSGSKPYDKQTIHLPNVGRLGSATPCAGGGVRIYSAASVKFTANVAINGLQIITRGDIEFTANGDVAGISAQAGQDIRMTANNEFSYCPPGSYDWDLAYRHRLVR